MSAAVARWAKKVYVAGPSSERARCEAFASQVRLLGWEITEPWWNQLAMLEAEGKGPHDASTAERHMISNRCFDAVEKASLLILLPPTPGFSTEGAWVELGVAFGLRRGRGGSRPFIWVVGDLPENRRFFTLHADRHFDSPEACLKALVEFA